ncbi:ATP-dependent RNA helicase DEAH12, chloroplastic [Nephila pilipes]|uniref:ATP-dependent RNA helicase DEAH12, chloroplastic n=1 Tax=Nephila pilipes TaxID=299642 RepID=A0A8X6QAD8_NEPPI|nr:ATP-dependent RNA helicase DEAH12, chloroplastic [Nephila pilipes]
MRRSRNWQWPRQNRYNTRSSSHLTHTIEGHSEVEINTRNHYCRMSNLPEREDKTLNDAECKEEPNIHFRSFCEGRESEIDAEPCHSLHEQRNFANQQRQNDRVSHQMSNRGFTRGRRNFKRIRSRRSVSDTDSISSSESQFSKRNPNANQHSNNPPNFPSEPKELMFHFSNTASNSPSFKNENVNSAGFSKYSNKVTEHMDVDKNICSNWPKKNFINQQNNDKHIPKSVTKNPRDTLSEYRNYKENCDKILQNLNPTDIIMDCREQVESDAKVCIIQCLKKIQEISSQNNCEVFKLHLDNLIQQQKQFEDYIAKVKGQLSVLFASNVQDLLQSCDIIRKNVQKECNVFTRSLPAYAFKSDILQKIHENQVTIISADSSYFLNILMPIFVKSEFPEHFLVCSETCQILTERLKRNVFQLLHHKIKTDEIDQMKFNNEINITTVEDMLQNLSSDYTLEEKNIFAVLNLSLKRSLNQDLILANMKDILIEKKKAKLVLMTSLYDQVHKYESFFSGITSVVVIKMPSLILPIKIVWKSSALLPTDDYVNDVVKTVLAIHTLNGPGDVIAFLPTFSDAKSASIAINEKLSGLQFEDLRCDMLNENSTNKYCLDLINKRTDDKRTIFLATDCVEMLVIPSVRYIIDCGLRKEDIFDSKKKIDVSMTTFISRDKSKLRKSLAGAFGTGVCYRLYSKEDYLKEMPSIEYAEILTVNPFNSMIRVFQHRPTTATTVEFVESLPDSTKENALKLLKKYKAIKDNTLTEIGKSIIKLPFPIRYSKLILLGVQWGLAYEAVILVAFFSVKGRVFQYSTEKDRQREIDAVKVNFIQYDSDTLSYLYIYKMWLESGCNEAWCEDHAINYSTLKNIRVKISEICQIVGESLKENIQQDSINTSHTSAESLIEMLFDCFMENLSVFTGHYKSGYRVLSSHSIAFLHPSSIICQTGNLPQFITFDHMISTNREFLISITAIPSNVIMDALTKQIIDFDYSDMFEKFLVQKIIEPVGERLIKQVLLGKKGQKLKAIECHIQSLLSTDSLVIEPVAEKGHVLVYALEHQIEEATKIVNDVLKRQFEDLINLEQVHILELKRGQISIPVELKWLRGAKMASVKVGMSSQSTVVIQNNLNTVENPSDQLPCIIQQSINVTWVRRPCNGSGFITFTDEDFTKARKQAMKNFHVLNSDVLVQLSKNSKNQLYFSGIPPEAKTSDLGEAFEKLLPDVKPVKVELKYVSPFETSQNELQEIKDTIEELCNKYTCLSDFAVIVPMPKQTATLMKAFINVSDDEDIGLAAENLSKCIIRNTKPACKPVYRSIIKSNLEICEGLKYRFQEMLSELQCKLREQFLEEELFDFVINRVTDDLAAIKMLSNRREILQILQRTVNELLEGEVLNKSFHSKLNKIFCHGGHMWLRSVEKTSGVHIIEDYINKSLRLYGSKENCQDCKHRIHQFLEDTENEAVTRIQLSGERNNRKLLKAIIKKFGANLEKFIESCELRNAMLDIKSCSISLLGSRDSIEKAEDSLKELARDLDSSTSEVIQNGEECPVCALPAFNLTFRLELCGHLYCSECIEGLIEQAQFPIRCCAEDCCHDIILEDICKALGDDPAKIKILLEKSMKHYIESQGSDIFYCPAPDCSMFFYKDEISSDKLNCPLCQNDICRKCNSVYHQGLSCDMYQGSKNDPDYSFKEWQKTSPGCKRCPRCNTAIEKNEGCDHMTCTGCGSHFCWQCVREFPNASAVYNHIPFCDKYPQVVEYGIEHHVVTTGQPVYSRAGQLAPDKLQIAKQEFQYTLDNDITRPSKSQWASPLYLVNKKDGSSRPFGDDRRHNAQVSLNLVVDS